MSLAFEDVTYDYASASARKRARKEGGAAAASLEPLALDHVSFSIPDGQFVGIIGHTGSGKSTLVQHMNGLLQPTSGRVVVDGLDLADRRNRRAVRRRVGIAFQYPEYQLFATTVEQDVSFGPRNLGVSSEEVERRTRAALERVGLAWDDVAQKSPFHLSGGQQRRVALAGILAMEPTTLVLDEPMAGLDPRGREEVLAIVRRLHDEGLTIVMVSHSMEDVAENAERVLVMDHGHLVMDGAPDEVFARGEELYRIGLDVPQATRFERRLRAAGLDLADDVHTLDALADAIVARLGTRTKQEYLAARGGGAGDDEGAPDAAGAPAAGAEAGEAR